MKHEMYSAERCETTSEAAARGLLDLMSGISEEYWCAGWLRDLEFELWNAVAGSHTQESGALTMRQTALLRLLSEECDGWWHWQNDTDNPQFVSLAEWRRVLAERKNSDPGQL
jgi:hypothetical protein